MSSFQPHFPKYRGAGYPLLRFLAAIFFTLTFGTTAASAQEPPSSVLAPEPAPNSGPKESDSLLTQAKSLAEQGRAVEAEPLARRALADNPASADAHFLLGYILFREIQQNAGATGGSAGSPSLDASDSQKAIAGADSNFTESRARASLAEFTEGAKYRTPGAFDLKIVALNYVLLDDYAAADKWLTKMLEWASNDSEGWYYLGRTKYNENRFEEAISAFQRCLKLDPKNIKAEDNLGLSYAGLGRAEDAIAAYQTAMAWQADASVKYPGPFIDMASLLLDQNRSTEAISYLHKAVEIAPSESKSHELLGKAYARLEQLPQAQAELENAIALAPQNLSLACMLAPVYRKRGLADKAKFQFDRCATLNGTRSSRETPRP